MSLNYPDCLRELLPNGRGSITGPVTGFQDNLLGPEHATGGWSRPMTHTIGFMQESKQRLSPDMAGASALGAAEAGSGRSLVKREGVGGWGWAREWRWLGLEGSCRAHTAPL